MYLHHMLHSCVAYHSVNSFVFKRENSSVYKYSERYVHTMASVLLSFGLTRSFTAILFQTINVIDISTCSVSIQIWIMGLHVYNINSQQRIFGSTRAADCFVVGVLVFLFFLPVIPVSEICFAFPVAQHCYTQQTCVRHAIVESSAQANKGAVYLVPDPTHVFQKILKFIHYVFWFSCTSIDTHYYTYVVLIAVPPLLLPLASARDAHFDIIVMCHKAARITHLSFSMSLTAYKLYQKKKEQTQNSKMGQTQTNINSKCQASVL